MKKIALAVSLCVLIAVPAYSWQFDAYSTDPGGLFTTYGLDFDGVIGQNYMLSGDVTSADQQVTLAANLVWAEIMIQQLPNDYYYGSALVGFWQVPGSYQLTITNGGYATGYSFDLGVPPAGAIAERMDRRIK